MASIWRDPIFDRTSHDIAFALQKIAEWKKGHTHSADVEVVHDSVKINEGEVSTSGESVALSADGIAYAENDALVVQLGGVYDLKGCLNLSDITRIEDNITYLSEKLTKYRYPIVSNSKEWTKDSLPNAQDMSRIADNIRSLFKGFVPTIVPDVPNIMLSYADVNTLERNLNELRELLDAMECSFITSGTTTSGATNRLPLRR